MVDLNDEDLKKHVTDKGAWFRLAYLILFALVFYVSMLVAFTAALIQFLARLFSGAAFPGLAEFGGNLATYQSQLSRYLTFSSDEKPFPFGDFPSKKAE